MSEESDTPYVEMEEKETKGVPAESKDIPSSRSEQKTKSSKSKRKKKGKKKGKLTDKEVNVLAVFRTGYFDTMMTFCRYVSEGKSPLEYESKLLREDSVGMTEEAGLLELIVPLMRADSIKSSLREAAKYKVKDSTKEKPNPFAKFSEVKLSPGTGYGEAQALVRVRAFEMPQDSFGKVNQFIAERVDAIKDNCRVRSEVYGEMGNVIRRGGVCGPEGMVGDTGICCGDGIMYSFVTGKVITYTEEMEETDETVYTEKREFVRVKKSYKYWKSNEPNKYCIPICRECGHYKDFV
jgi:hypothetical protein